METILYLSRWGSDVEILFGEIVLVSLQNIKMLLGDEMLRIGLKMQKNKEFLLGMIQNQALLSSIMALDFLQHMVM